jgi:hypothetical protein
MADGGQDARHRRCILVVVVVHVDDGRQRPWPLLRPSRCTRKGRCGVSLGVGGGGGYVGGGANGGRPYHLGQPGAISRVKPDSRGGGGGSSSWVWVWLWWGCAGSTLLMHPTAGDAQAPP